MSLINIDNRFLTTVVACQQQECCNGAGLTSIQKATEAPISARKLNAERTGEQRITTKRRCLLCTSQARVLEATTLTFKTSEKLFVFFQLFQELVPKPLPKLGAQSEKESHMFA